MKKLIFLFLFFLPLASFAQDLYIKVEAGLSPSLFRTTGWGLNERNNYRQLFSIIDGEDILWFYCGNRAAFSQTLPISALANYPTAQTVSQVMTIFKSKGNYIAQEDWVGSFKNFYIIQVLPATNQIEVSKVEIMDYDIIHR